MRAPAVSGICGHSTFGQTTTTPHVDTKLACIISVSAQPAVHGDRNRERFVTDTCTASNQSEIALNSFFMRNIWSCCSSKDEDLEALRELLHDGVDVDSKNDLGETPLLLASSRGLERMTTTLLEAGADVHVKDWESGWTPLHRSLYFGHIRVAMLLLQAGAVLDGRDQPASQVSLKKSRSRSRSESIGASSPTAGFARTTCARRRSDGFGDGDGNSPLDVLSLELRPELKKARESGRGGDVYSFGKADFFLGYDSFGKSNVILPRRVETLANLQVVRLAASKHHSAAVTRCGRLFTWGHGRSGRLGHGNEEVCMLPTLVQGMTAHKVVDVAASETHTAAFTRDGEVYTWGRDRFGQLGHGAGSSGRLSPKRVEGVRKLTVVGVATGAEHTAVVTSSGECYTWGRNNHGQLGLAGVNQTCSPRAVSYLASGASRGSGGVGRHILKVSASSRSTVVVTRGVDRGSGLRPVNEVHQWGHGSHVPSRVNFNSVIGGGSSSRWQTHDARVDVTDVAAAKFHNLALSSVGQVFTWGFGADNLGLDPREARTSRGPKLVAAMLPENCGGNGVYISASDQHSCVVTDTGDLYTWGTAGEDVGALGHGDNRWQPVAKRVASLKKVSLVAAGPDHTVVLVQASCPPLPHLALSTSATSQGNTTRIRGDRTLSLEEGVESKGELDSDSDLDSVDEEGDEQAVESVGELPAGLCRTRSDGGSEPLTLKQHCELALAREVDLRNAASLLAYADALDAPDLVKYCATFVSSNLDGMLVLGRESDRCCLLETCGTLACSLLCTGGEQTRNTRRPYMLESAVTEDGSVFDVPDEEGLDREAMATALARAEMRAKTPSAKVAARAVRSLKKKIARIVELEGRRDSGKELSLDQASKVQQKPTMEAELSYLDSQLERAKLVQVARGHRLQAASEPAGKMTEREEMDEPLRGATPDAKRTLFVEKDGQSSPAQCAPYAGGLKEDPQNMPQLDLSQGEASSKANEKRPIKCEACRVECGDSSMYADHLRGKRHRATMARLEKQLHEATKGAQAESEGPRTWANVSMHGPASATSSANAKTMACPIGPHAIPPSSECSRDPVKGRRASYPEPAARQSTQRRRGFNELPPGSVTSTMRQTLEKQHKAATSMMRETSLQLPEPTGARAQETCLSLPSIPAASISRQQPGLKIGHETAAAPSFSLVDFMGAPESKKKGRRKSSSDCNAKNSIGHVWAPGEEASAGARARDAPSKRASTGTVEDSSKSRKSFHEILEEQEQEKQERDEYGESVWFVSRKPRSTSFEGIVQQQRREELMAEEGRKREVELEMEEEMLRIALALSRNEVQPSDAASSRSRGGQGKKRKEARSRPSLNGARDAGRGARSQKDNGRPLKNASEQNGEAQTAKASRKNAAGGAKAAHETQLGGVEIDAMPASSGGSRSRRTRRPHHGQRCGAEAGRGRDGREDLKFGTSAPP